MKTHLSWRFPLPEPGCGINLGNGTLGLMVWGNGELIVSVGRNGFWDRRNASDFVTSTTFTEVRGLLESGDMAGLHAKLNRSQPVKQAYRKPTQIPCGRLVFAFESGWSPEDASFELASGKLTVRLINPSGESATVLFHISMDSELARVEFSENIGAVRTQAKPSWEFVGDVLSQDGVAEPKRWETATTGGFFQSLPADPGVTLAYAWKDAHSLVFTTGLGDGETAAKNLAETIGAEAIQKAITESEAWWAAYFSTKPALDIPDAELSDAYLYSLVKLAGLTAPAGVAASLVGPFMDDDTLPGWGNDYHFNINAQMIYWPVLGANCCDHLWPLWDLMLGWLPELRKTAEKFYDVPGALMLPCGVSDRCQAGGSFWEGLIDVGCVAWMGQLAWLHYRHTLDKKVLEEVAWPLLSGAFESFYATVERIEEKGKSRLSLPVSVSPEYASPKGNWGRDSSFFLAGFHMMAQLLPQAARLLGKPEDPRWREVEEDLPPYCTITGPDQWDFQKETERLALWKGQDYENSHRHHSMLAAIYPFRTVNPYASEHRELLARSLQYWLTKGAGAWAGWTIPWTSSICSYTGMPDGAIFWLKYDLNLYFNAGGNSDHNGDFTGVGLMARDYILNPKDRYRAVVQCTPRWGSSPRSTTSSCRRWPGRSPSFRRSRGNGATSPSTASSPKEPSASAQP